MNEYQNSASCTFSGSAKTLEEKKFEVSVRYDYKEIKQLSFTILPEVAIVIPPEAEINLMDEYCFLDFSGNEKNCEFRLNPIEWCKDSNKIDCIKSVERKAEIEDDLGESAFATLEDNRKYLKIWAIDKNKLEDITYPKINIDYTYPDREGEERESETNVIPIIVLYNVEKNVTEKDFIEDFEGKFIYLEEALFNLNISTEKQLRIKSVCGASEELSVGISGYGVVGDIMIWYTKDEWSYKVDYYEFGLFKKTIFRESDPKDLKGKTYMSSIGALEILTASEDKINIKVVSGSFSSFSLTKNSHSKSCDYILVLEEKDNKYILTMAKLKK